jgi:hypothetical protein
MELVLFVSVVAYTKKDPVELKVTPLVLDITLIGSG